MPNAVTVSGGRVTGSGGVRAGESELQAGRERDQGIAQLPLEQMNETLL